MTYEARAPRELPEGKVRKSAVATTATLLLLVVMLVLDVRPAFADGTVTVSVAGKGDATGPGISCNDSGGPDCSEFYADTTFQDCDPERRPPCMTVTEPPSIQLTAGADRNGYAFEGWTGCDFVNARTCELTVITNQGLTARFRDAEAPGISTPSPSGGVQSGTITLGASAGDNSGTVSRVEFRVRGVLVATDTTAPYSASFNTVSVADGFAGLTARRTTPSA